MTTAPSIMIRMVAFCLVAGAAVYAAGRPYEAYMVSVPRTEIYKGDQRTDFRLYRGDVVAARPLERHKDWLILILGDTVYQAAAAHFARLVDLKTDYQRETAELQAEIDELDRDIESVLGRIEQLYAAEQAISFDSMVRYRYRRMVPMAASSEADVSGRPGSEGQPSFRIVEDYVDKIQPSTARNQARRWKRERQDLEDELSDYRKRRRSLKLQISNARAKRGFVDWRFRSFRLGEGILRAQPYVCMEERTPLFLHQTLAVELDQDVVITATLNRTHQQWLKVRFQNRVYDARKSAFLSLLGVESAFGKRVVLLKERIDKAEEENDLLEARQDLLESIMLAADYRSRLNYVSLSGNPFGGGYAGSRFYRPRSSPADATEVILRRRARSFIRRWEDELEDVAETIDNNRDKLRSWRRELAGLEPRLEDLRTRLLRGR